MYLPQKDLETILLTVFTIGLAWDVAVWCWGFLFR
jgi:hypothetical protein